MNDIPPLPPAGEQPLDPALLQRLAQELARLQPTPADPREQVTVQEVIDQYLRMRVRTWEFPTTTTWSRP